MEENKVLLEVVSDEDGTAVRCECKGNQEAFQIALAMHQVLTTAPGIAIMFALITKMSIDDPEFKKALEEHSVDLSAFEEILKH